MSSISSVLLINAIPNQGKEAQLQSYLGQILPIFAAAGGKMLARYKSTEQLMGNGGPSLIATFEFPSETAIKDMLAGADFNALSSLRDEVYQRLDLLICAPL